MNDYWKLTTPGKGLMDLRLFDEGIVSSIGAVLDSALDPPAFQIKNVPCAGDVTVFMSSADPNIVSETLPRIVVTRSSWDDAGQRIHPGWKQWRDRYDDSPEIDSTGEYKEMEQLQQAWPYDISYDLDIRAATKREAQAILNYIQRNTTVKPKGYVTVKDSVGDTRTYDCLYDSVSQADEVEDIHMRYPGVSVTIRVLGELDIFTTEVAHTVESQQMNVGRK